MIYVKIFLNLVFLDLYINQFNLYFKKINFLIYLSK